MATRSDELHPAVLKAQQKLADGRMSRRDFLRLATLLGASVPTAYALAACFSWVFDPNEFRMIFEYLTETGSDNITRPYLAEKWDASPDLKEWTLHLRQDVKWYDPVKQAMTLPLTAADVLYNFKSWLN